MLLLSTDCPGVVAPCLLVQLQLQRASSAAHSDPLTARFEPTRPPTDTLGSHLIPLNHDRPSLTWVTLPSPFLDTRTTLKAKLDYISHACLIPTFKALSNVDNLINVMVVLSRMLTMFRRKFR